MEQIQHKYIDVRGLKLHVAEIGTGPVIVFLHGFPEIWYSWRHQMISVANAGFHAIAPDNRGYGLSGQPPEPEKTTFNDLVDDLLVILDSLNISKAFLVGKDFGARPAYHFALLHPERVLGVVSLGAPFILSGPQHFPRHLLHDGFYMLRWQEPGHAEADFSRFDTKTIVRNIYILFSGSELPVAKEDQEIMDMVDPSTPLPHWFTEDDLATYATLYENSGFCTPLQVPYRAFLEDIGITDPKVSVPAMLIMGEEDYVLKFPGLADYISSGMVKNYVPDLEIKFLPGGTHFIQEQFPDQVNQLILAFLNKHAQ
ncbi:Alpha/beta hydrolase fold-1 [Macleaya cordata]|uniref:Alpha/beta hydrolase fold-1 n=1 Tax=Macleaya cordata TaxID=56857 RepID=A0A200PQP5_MACCD|nr:Alpha/beta hydrolase fold-1 [Macleaya cordata]